MSIPRLTTNCPDMSVYRCPGHYVAISLEKQTTPFAIQLELASCTSL
jgi:hypothetical protein